MFASVARVWLYASSAAFVICLLADIAFFGDVPDKRCGDRFYNKFGDPVSAERYHAYRHWSPILINGGALAFCSMAAARLIVRREKPLDANGGTVGTSGDA